MLISAIETFNVGRVAKVLPEPVRAWPEHSEALGFAGRDAVDFAASWFQHRKQAQRRRIELQRSPVGGAEWVRSVTVADGADGPVWIDKGTGEIVPKPEVRRADLDTGYWVDTFGADSRHRTEMAPLDHRIVITPGTVGLRVTDPRDSSDPYFADIEIDEEGNVVPSKPVVREPITEFSRKSRTRLIRRCLSIPWGEYVEPDERIHVVTLTAPADYLAVFKDHKDGYKALRSFQDRLRYATGRKARGFWKLEFQRRGAPHWHLILITPRYIDGQRLTQWLSQAWYEAVGSGVESHLRAGTNVDIEQSLQASDALRLALYFAGYSTRKDKEYQHQVPEEGWVDENGSTGRFWGYFGVKPAEVEVRITPDDLIQTKRLLRARERSQRGSVDFNELPEAKQEAWLRKGRRPDSAGRVSVPLTRARTVYRTVYKLDRTGDRPEHGPDPIEIRTVRRRRRTRSLTGTATGCTAFVNNGPGLAVAIAKTLTEPTPWPKGQRRPLP
ncbi:MAG: rolling circle replication-associated protein [Acidimicrobiales bacterium]